MTKTFINNVSLLCIITMLVLSLYIFIVEFFFSYQKNFPEGDKHIAIVLDVSQSMWVQDVSGVSRLIAAKKDIISQIQNLSWYQFSLNIFAWESQRILPFTSDIGIISTFLSGLDSRNITLQGTNIQEALQDAAESFLEGMSWDIFLYTDWDEDIIKLDKQLLKQLSSKQIFVHVIAVWSEQGGLIPSWNPLRPYKVYQWEAVLARVNKLWLESLAWDLWWEYYDLGEWAIMNQTPIHREVNIPIWIFILSLIWLLFLYMNYTQIYKNKWIRK